MSNGEKRVVRIPAEDEESADSADDTLPSVFTVDTEGSQSGSDVEGEVDRSSSQSRFFRILWFFFWDFFRKIFSTTIIP